MAESFLRDTPGLRADTCCCTVPWNACQAVTATFAASFVVAALWWDAESHSIAWLYTVLCVASVALAVVRGLVFHRHDKYDNKWVDRTATLARRVPYKVDAVVLGFLVVGAIVAWFLGGSDRAPGAIGVSVLYALAALLLGRVSYRTWLARGEGATDVLTEGLVADGAGDVPRSPDASLGSGEAV